jgi:hypothetical protein
VLDPSRLLVPVIVTRCPFATGTTAVILSIVVPFSLAAVVTYFQVLPRPTGKGTDAPDPAAAAGLDAVAVADADVVAGVPETPVAAAELGELPELAAEPQPASDSPTRAARPASSRRRAEMVNVSKLMWIPAPR